MMTPTDVRLFWKLALSEPCPLRSVQLPHTAYALPEIPNLHVTLLYYGGRKASEAANMHGVSAERFRQVETELQRRAGEAVVMRVNRVCIHREVVFANVSLPHGFPCLNTDAFVKFRISPMSSGSIVIHLRKRGDQCKIMELPHVLTLDGTIELECGKNLNPPFCRIRSIGQQQQRLHVEVQGNWVRVKKHSSLGCAEITFPCAASRDAILRKYKGRKVQLNGVPVDVKERRVKGSNFGPSGLEDVLFVGWKHRNTIEIRAEDLKVFFDEECDKFRSAREAYLSQFFTEIAPSAERIEKQTKRSRKKPTRQMFAAESICVSEGSAFHNLSLPSDVSAAYNFTSATRRVEQSTTVGIPLARPSKPAMVSCELHKVHANANDGLYDSTPASRLGMATVGIPLSTALDEAVIFDDCLARRTDADDIVSFQSKASSSLDDVVLLRLTRMSRSQEVTSLLMESPLLEECHARVRDVGCEVSPTWANGAKLFVPLSAQQLQDGGIDLKDLKHHHIVALRGDIEIIEGALAKLPYRKRAKVSMENRSFMSQIIGGLAKRFCKFRKCASVDLQSVRSARSVALTSEVLEEHADNVEVIVECSLKTNSSIEYLSQ